MDSLILTLLKHTDEPLILGVLVLAILASVIMFVAKPAIGFYKDFKAVDAANTQQSSVYNAMETLRLQLASANQTIVEIRQEKNYLRDRTLEQEKEIKELNRVVQELQGKLLKLGKGPAVPID